MMDATAFSELFHTCSKWLYGEALYNCRNPQDAEDIVQDVFSALWAKRGSIDEDKDIRNYLYVSMRNAVVSGFKKRLSAKKHAAYHIRRAEQHAPDPSGIIDRKNRIRYIRGAVQHIRGKSSREAIRAIYLDEESYKHLSARTGFPIQTLRNAVARGIKSLNNKIKV